MKVLSITNLNIGNSATMAERSLFKGLHQKGVDLTVVAANPNNESDDLIVAGIKVVFIPIKNKIDIKASRSVRALIKQENFDILHLTYARAITTGIIASIGLDVKIIGYIGSLSVHWHDLSAYLSFLNPRIDRMICLSNGVEQHMIKQAPRNLRGKTVRIYKGYEPSWINAVKPVERSTLSLPENAMIICCVANVRKIKGIPYLIKASDLLPPGLPVYFLLVGPGMDSPPIRRIINKSKYRENFRVLGYTREVLSYTALCDVYVQPSITEGLGRSVVEAMCLGKPVIVSGTGGVGELVDEGITGYHIPPRSPSALAEKIMICYSNRDKLFIMGAKGRDKIEKEFNSVRMIDETYKLFKSLV
jgi:L-malate glycosyltransferase